MNRPSPILAAVRAALYGAALASSMPALIATGVGIAQAQPAEPIARCQQGQEGAACATHPVADQPERHPEDIVMPLQFTATPPSIGAIQARHPNFLRAPLGLWMGPH
jgi:hypothetical protein